MPPHFDYGCTSWYPLMSKVLKTKLQIAQNKCKRFRLKLLPLSHISPSHFRKINWLPVERRVELCSSTNIFKHWKGIAQSYQNEMFMPLLNNYNARSQVALNIPLCRTTKGQKSMPFFGPKIWNKLSTNIKAAGTIASLTQPLKFLVSCKSAQYFFDFSFFYYYFCYSFIYLIFDSWLFFTIFLWVHTSRGTQMK